MRPVESSLNQVILLVELYHHPFMSIESKKPRPLLRRPHQLRRHVILQPASTETILLCETTQKRRLRRARMRLTWWGWCPSVMDLSIGVPPFDETSPSGNTATFGKVQADWVLPSDGVLLLECTKNLRICCNGFMMCRGMWRVEWSHATDKMKCWLICWCWSKDRGDWTLVIVAFKDKGFHPFNLSRLYYPLSRGVHWWK